MGSQSPIRLAILEADDPAPRTAAAYGSYGGLFKALLASAVAPEPVDSVLALSYHNVLHDPDGAYPALEDVDAILITGSRHSAYDEDAWIAKLVRYTRECIEGGRVKVVGVCFGHQIAGLAMGGEVRKNDKGWEISVTEVELTKEGKELFGLDVLKIHEMHRDMVVSTPPAPTVPLASTATCPVQGFLLPGRVVTIQGHPEFTAAVVTELVELRHDIGLFSNDMYEDGMARVRSEHDGVQVARAFLRFLKG